MMDIVVRYEIPIPLSAYTGRSRVDEPRNSNDIVISCVDYSTCTTSSIILKCDPDYHPSGGNSRKPRAIIERAAETVIAINYSAAVARPDIDGIGSRLQSVDVGIGAVWRKQDRAAGRNGGTARDTRTAHSMHGHILRIGSARAVGGYRNKVVASSHRPVCLDFAD